MSINGGSTIITQLHNSARTYNVPWLESLLVEADAMSISRTCCCVKLGRACTVAAAVHSITSRRAAGLMLGSGLPENNASDFIEPVSELCV